MKNARLSGLIYLVLIISGIIGLAYIPSQLINRDSTSDTVANLTHSEMLFKLGILSEIICFISFLFLALSLYNLLKEVNKNVAKLMVVFIIISVSMSFVNILNKFSVLTLLHQAEYMKDMSPDYIASQIMLYLDFYANGNKLVAIFWGLWLFPFGYLVYKSGFLPKILGIFLMLGCFGYLVEFVGPFLFSSYRDYEVLGTIIGIPSPIGEFGICLWLLIMGTKKFTIKKTA
tara:strand:+ start:4613 stop:5305 length:693 start_codon:yes stop_codon:yes gene_type:complete